MKPGDGGGSVDDGEIVMQLKKMRDGDYEVFVAGRAIGAVRKVPQNPAYGRGSGPVSEDVLVWGAFTNGRVGMDFRTRREAAEAVLRAKGIAQPQVMRFNHE